MPDLPERDAMIERLRRRYAGGGTGMARFLANLRLQRKRWMWTAVVASAHALKRFLDICGGAFGLLAFSRSSRSRPWPSRLRTGGRCFSASPG